MRRAYGANGRMGVQGEIPESGKKRHDGGQPVPAVPLAGRGESAFLSFLTRKTRRMPGSAFANRRLMPSKRGAVHARIAAAGGFPLPWRG